MLEVGNLISMLLSTLMTHLNCTRNNHIDMFEICLSCANNEISKIFIIFIKLALSL